MRCSMLLRQRLLKLLRVLLKVGLNFLDYIESTVLAGLQVRWILFFLKVVLLRPIRTLTSTDVSVHFESVNVLTSVEVRQLH